MIDLNEELQLKNFIVQQETDHPQKAIRIIKSIDTNNKKLQKLIDNKDFN